jgi:hypothetical protein
MEYRLEESHEWVNPVYQQMIDEDFIVPASTKDALSSSLSMLIPRLNVEHDGSMPTYLELMLDFYEDLGLRSDHSRQKTLLFVSNKTKMVVTHDNNVDETLTLTKLVLTRGISSMVVHTNVPGRASTPRPNDSKFYMVESDDQLWRSSKRRSNAYTNG